jgi:hypothetical protein
MLYNKMEYSEEEQIFLQLQLKTLMIKMKLEQCYKN